MDEATEIEAIQILLSLLSTYITVDCYKNDRFRLDPQWLQSDGSAMSLKGKSHYVDCWKTWSETYSNNQAAALDCLLKLSDLLSELWMHIEDESLDALYRLAFRSPDNMRVKARDILCKIVDGGAKRVERELRRMSIANE